ncbi:MAG: hypothetical protein WBE18_08740 [Gammaproteobacteria bacterium]
MKPKYQEKSQTDDLFRNRLDNIINLRHELVMLSETPGVAHLGKMFGASKP